MEPKENFWRILVAPCSYKEWGLRFHKGYWKYMINMLHSLCFQVIPKLWEVNKSKCKSLFVVNLPVQRADSMIPTQEPDHLQMNHSFVYWIKCFAEKLWLKWFVHIAGIATFVMNTECATTLYFCLIKEFRLNDWFTVLICALQQFFISHSKLLCLKKIWNIVHKSYWLFDACASFLNHESLHAHSL